MSKKYFLTLLVCYVLAAVLLFYSTNTSRIVGTEHGQAAQASVWQGLSQLHIFAALHLMFGAIVCTLLGVFCVFLFWRPARYIWILGILGLLLYYRVDPRFHPGEWNALIRGIVLFCSGVLSCMFFFREKQQKEFLRSSLVLLFSFFFSVVFARLITHIPLSQLIVFPISSYLVFFLLFMSGLLSSAAFVGEVGACFAADPEIAQGSGLRRKNILFSFAASMLIFVLAIFVILWPLGLEKPFWVLLSPAVPVFMSIYAPMTWFFSEGSTQIFSNGMLEDTVLDQTRARLYLGIFFQYLSLFTFVLLGLAIRKNYNRLLLLVAHLMLIFYWFPALWVALKIRQG